MKRIGRITLIELIVVVMIFLILGGIVAPLAISATGLGGGFYKDYSQGVRAGHLMKVSKKGIWYKSYEAELQIVDNMALNSTPGETNSTKVFWQVSTADEALGKKLEDLVGKEVKIKYTQYLVKPIQFDSDYEILSYEEVK